MNYKANSRKRTSYLFLNTKQRITILPANTNDNILRWRDLPPLPPGKGKLSLVLGTYRSGVVRNDRFIISIVSGAYNYYSSDNERKAIGYFEATESVRTHVINHPHHKEIKIQADTSELRNIDIRIDFIPERPNTGIPGQFLPVLDANNQFSFVFKFEYD
jgi:hypothetical protein